ncbi:MAG: tail fiber domain-containing protein [Flavihumibacter sp.]|nr:tail fiber domain-containing protein [Flavihumibacter sp.]
MKKLVFTLFVSYCTIQSVNAQLGIGTTSPNSMLDVRGSFAANYRAVTGTATIAATDNTVVFTGTSAATLTLPTAIGIEGRVYWIKNASTTSPTPTLTISTTSSQTIDGNPNWAMDEPNESIRVVSDGSNWYVLNQDVPVAKTSTTGGAWLEGGNRVSAAKNFGTITNYHLPFITNNLERMRLTTGGFLGLGTTSPVGRFHAVSESSESGDDYVFDDYGAGISQGFYFTKSRGTVASPTNLAQNDQIGWIRFVPRYNGSLGFSNGSSMEAYYRGDGTTGLTDLRFFTSGSERLRINESGNVGIGSSTFNSTNPEKLLVDVGSTGSYNVISGRGNLNNYLQLNIKNNSNGTSASSDIVATANNGNESTNYIDMGINSGGYSNTSLPILDGINTAYFYATGRNFFIGNGTVGRDLIFFTNGFANADEKMRILSGGNVGIGTTAPADKLSVAGIAAPSADNTYTLGKSALRWSAVYAANGTIQTSDARLKTNIQPLRYGLKEVLQLKPVSYNWIDASMPDGKIGLIAQEVKAVIPEVVVGDETKENLGMNYAELVPVLINAVKEQQEQIDAIEKKIYAAKKSAKQKRH